MIEIRNVDKYFYNEKGSKFKVLDKLSLTIEEGDIFGIIGYSGAGKSTLIRTLNGLEKIDDGEILIDGLNLAELSGRQLLEFRKNIGFIFQNFNLINQKNVYENLSLALEINGFTGNKEDRIDQVLDYVGLRHKKYDYPKNLSGGEKQRISIARALINKPKFILGDEPTSALDPENTKLVLNLLRKINEELGITIIIISHEMSVIKDLCKHMALMEKGRILETGSVESIFTRPKSLVAKSFIQSVRNDFTADDYRKEFKGLLVKLIFPDNSSKKPIVSYLINNFRLEVNIISGNINKLRSKDIGHLILEIAGDSEDIEASLDFLKRENINWEVI